MGNKRKTIFRESVDMFKIGKILPKIMALLEEEGLNIAEAETIPRYLEKEIMKNSELNEKTKQFTVNIKLLGKHF